MPFCQGIVPQGCLGICPGTTSPLSGAWRASLVRRMVMGRRGLSHEVAPHDHRTYTGRSVQQSLWWWLQCARMLGFFGAPKRHLQHAEGRCTGWVFRCARAGQGHMCCAGYGVGRLAFLASGGAVCQASCCRTCVHCVQWVSGPVAEPVVLHMMAMIKDAWFCGAGLADRVCGRRSFG